MTQQTDDRMRELFLASNPGRTPDPAIVDRAILRGRRRRQRRRLGFGVGAVAATAAIGFAATTVGLPGAGPHRAEVLLGQPASPSASPAPARLPTVAELSATLATALPASIPDDARRERWGARVTRQLAQGRVEAWVYEQPGTKGRPMTDAQVATWMTDYCSHQSRVSGCEATPAGWATWIADKPDVPRVDQQSRDVQVRYVRRDGLVIALQASNYLDVAAPTSTAPVLSRDELIELATTVDWFPSAGASAAPGTAG